MNPLKVFIGLAMIMLGLTLLALKSVEVSYGGVVLIGPIPVVFGSNSEMALLAVILAAILLLIPLLTRW